MSSPNLQIEHIAEGQNQKEVTANDAFDALDLALTGIGAWDPAEAGPSAAAFRRAFAWRPDAALTADASFAVPEVQRPFAVLNPSDTYTVSVTRGAAVFTVAPGTAGWFFCDGAQLWRLA